MKRVFIRLFGCVLSAIGLGASYDTTMTLVMGKDKAPGSAWAAANDSCYYNSGCIPSGMYTSSSGITGITSECNNEDGGKYSYHVLLRPFYVGWLNKSYSGTPITGEWPLNFGGNSRVDIDYTFSGTGGIYPLQGSFYKCTSNTPQASTTLSLCSRYDGIGYGTSTGVGDSPDNLSFRNGCVLNSEEVGGVSYDNYYAGSKRYGAVYMYSPQPFIDLGCCSYGGGSGSSGSTSSGSGSSGSGAASTSGTTTSCKCYYAQATQEYSYYYYKTASSTDTAGWVYTHTVPFYEPFVFYYFEGCEEGNYQVQTFASSEDRNFGINLMTSTSWVRLRDGDGKITSLCNYELVGSSMTTIKDGENAFYENIWNACEICPEMTSIRNSSSFSPSITSMGTASFVTGSNTTLCYANVRDNKDATGTFNLTSCTSE